VKMHRGAIEVKSKVGEGTTFWVKLPASPSAKSQETVG
jgi:signal transduction histidine kinase